MRWSYWIARIFQSLDLSWYETAWWGGIRLLETVGLVIWKKKRVYVHVISFYKTNSVCGRQYNLVNKTLLRLPAGLIQRLVFHLWWNLIFLPKLYMTSEEEGRAKPSLSSNYTENHIISLPLSPHGLPSTVLLVDSVCLCHSREQACILNESWRRDWRRLRERRRMESMNLQRKHNWDTKLSLACTSWSADWAHWLVRYFFHLWDQVLC